jgi:hypothetical protein
MEYNCSMSHKVKDKVSLTCKQGATFTRRITYKSNGVIVNLTGYTARMQVRPSYAYESSVLTVDLTTGSGITITGAIGAIDLAITAGVTAAITAGNYVYDLEVVAPNGTVTRLLEGPFIVTPEVTL